MGRLVAGVVVAVALLGGCSGGDDSRTVTAPDFDSEDPEATVEVEVPDEVADAIDSCADAVRSGEVLTDEQVAECADVYITSSAPCGSDDERAYVIEAEAGGEVG